MRSFTNNNPLNIKRTDLRLAGLSEEQTDSKYFQFVAPEYGIKAAFDRIKDFNINKHRKTVGAIISMWAPPDTNDTLSYIKFVCTICKCEPEYIVDITDTDFMVKLLGAMIRFENRTCPYTPSQLRKGILLNA